MNKKRQIQECILNIDMTCRNMYFSYQEIQKLKIPVDSVIYSDLIRYNYIQLCSILDEFVILSGQAKDDLYLRDTLYVLSPALKAINKYTGIRKARNYMLAHFNRDKKNNFYPWWFALKGLKLPRTYKEINQIFVWLHSINSIIVTRYCDELKEISNSSKKDVDEYFNWIESEEAAALTNPTPLDEIYSDIEVRMREKNIPHLIVDPAMTELIQYIRKKNEQAG